MQQTQEKYTSKYTTKAADPSLRSNGWNARMKPSILALEVVVVLATFITCITSVAMDGNFA